MLEKLGQGQVLFQLFPMTMKSTNIPFCHSSNTIRVYNLGIAKNMESTLVNNVMKHINFVAFYTIK